MSRTLAVVLGLMLVAGCTITAPKYSPSLDNINRLRDAGAAPIKIGSFTADPKNKDSLNKLSLRGSPYVSPYNNSFVSYLEEAVRLELDDARLLDPNAPTALDAMLLRNDVDAMSMGTGSADVEAKFTLLRGGQVLYEAAKKGHTEWESSFAGAVAIPAAAENYPTAMQKLLTELFSDPAFLKAIKR